MLMPQHDNYDELLRLAALRRTGILDTPPAVEFDRIADAARTLFGSLAAMVTFVDAERQWFKARAGVDVIESPRSASFCSHCIEYRNLLWIEDTTEDPRFLDNPFVAGDPHVRFYAGAPIRDADGWLIGTVCVVDTAPRPFDPALSAVLIGLAEVASKRVCALKDEYMGTGVGGVVWLM